MRCIHFEDCIYPRCGTSCRADDDGDCHWEHCPQLRDGEPHKSGRHCSRDKCDLGEAE